MTWKLETTEGHLSPAWAPIIKTLREDQQKQIRDQGRDIHLLKIPYRPNSMEWINSQKNSRLAVFFIGSLENYSHSAHYVFLLTSEGDFVNLHSQANQLQPLKGYTVEPGEPKKVQASHLEIQEYLVAEAQKFILSFSNSPYSL